MFPFLTQRFDTKQKFDKRKFKQKKQKCPLGKFDQREKERGRESISRRSGFLPSAPRVFFSNCQVKHFSRKRPPPPLLRLWRVFSRRARASSQSNTKS